jgi:hypothetical protein
MAIVRFEKKAIPLGVGENGTLKWGAGIRLSNKTDFALVSNRGETLLFDTKDEADNYLEENY